MKKQNSSAPKNSKKTSPSADVPRARPIALEGEQLTTNQGLRVSDNHNSLKAGLRGPTLLEDFVMREKISSFDHERIPERAVHARGAGAFGYFECTKAFSKFCAADFLSEVGKKTPLLVRFSTVAGSRGSADTVRDVRGFAVKMYTQEGNWDFVGNNIPVFFIQDAIKFPDLIHAVKPEPNNEIPQASSAHDTFWDFISLMPESTHMIFWHLSDRAIPRSFRMMEGFGVHTYRMVNSKGEAVFVKFHWKPKLGVHGLVWDEAQSIAGKDPDFHRRDLFEAIEDGAFPEWEFGVQVIPEADEHKFDFDLLDPTKLVPEELVPVTILGRMVLDRNPDNYFSEIEMAVFHPGHLVPGLDLSNDPLLQGRLFSYTDTQLTRLGGPNYHELPVNRPLANINNHQRDGFGRQTIAKGRVAYEPNSLGGGCPFHSPDKLKGFVSAPERVEGHKIRARSPSFGDHFSQAQLFFRSQSPPEQNHIRDAFIFELSKVEVPEIRERMLRTLMLVDADLTRAIAEGLGVPAPKKGEEPPSPANPANNIVPKNRATAVAELEASQLPKTKRVGLPAKSKALSMILNSPEGVTTRKVALLVSETSDGAAAKSLRQALEQAGVVVEYVAPGVGPLKMKGLEVTPEKSIASTPSVVYDGVVVLSDKKGYKKPEDLGHAVKFVGQAFKHLKTVGITPATRELFDAAVVAGGQGAAGLVSEKLPALAAKFLGSLRKHRHWDRADLVGTLPY